ncbi:MAG: cytochrome c [Planctomycetota bacterium]
MDGARPDVETARRYGLRYVHIPIGYDGIKSDEGLSLARLVRDTDGPFYIHCHHGRHRGPAAAAIVCIAAGKFDCREALEILERAGTDRKYRGLWRDVENYRVPSDHEELPRLVEIATVGSLAAAMARIDRAYDNLKRCRDAKWSIPAAHPDVVPGHEALLIKEAFRETGRHRDDESDEQFSKWLAEAETAAKNVENAIARNTSQVGVHFRNLGASCRRCHDKYRK